MFCNVLQTELKIEMKMASGRRGILINRSIPKSSLKSFEKLSTTFRMISQMTSFEDSKKIFELNLITKSDLINIFYYEALQNT